MARFSKFLRIPVVVLSAVFISQTPGLALAQNASTATDPSAVTQSAAVAVDGFRSAKFGMTQDEVRAAIGADFDLEDDAIIAGRNRAERTDLLTIRVPDLLTGGGTAQVSYVFGYQSHTLIQVGVSWSAAIDPEVTEDTLYSNGDALTAHFMAEGYDANTVRTGVVLDNGILLFRGEDADGHATILLLQGSYVSVSDGTQALQPTALALLYAVDPANPDVFKIDKGQF